MCGQQQPGEEDQYEKAQYSVNGLSSVKGPKSFNACEKESGCVNVSLGGQQPSRLSPIYVSSVRWKGIKQEETSYL